MIEGIDSSQPAGLDGRQNNTEGPGNPDHILYAIQQSAFGPFVLDHKAGFLKAGSGTGPAAECSPNEKRRHKKESKHEKAANDNSLGSSYDDQVRREVIYRGWEEQERYEYESLSDSLSFFNGENPFRADLTLAA